MHGPRILDAMQDHAKNDRRDDGWTIRTGDSPVIGTAIHSGGRLRDECRALMALAEAARRREEDPFTEEFIADFPTRIVVRQSRFEVDLNRARDAAIYLAPEQCWGLDVWTRTPPREVVARSLAFHDAYYAALRQTLSDIQARYGRFVLVDVHSYNHRRDGANAEATAQERAPDINIGTFSMDRRRWGYVVDPFMEALSGHSFRGGRIDVRENVSFQGKGEQTRFVHAAFPETGCAIAVEFKKIFMDEWTGEPDRQAIAELRAILGNTVPVLEKALRSGP